MRNGFRLFLSMYGHKHSFVVNSTFQDKKYLQFYLELIFESLLEHKSLGQKSTKTNLFVLQKDYRAPELSTIIEDIDSHFCQENEKSFVQTMCTQTDCVRTIHVPKKFNIAVFILTIRGECAAHRNCSQSFQSCLLRNNGYCRGDDVAIVKVDNFCGFELICV